MVYFDTDLFDLNLNNMAVLLSFSQGDREDPTDIKEIT